VELGDGFVRTGFLARNVSALSLTTSEQEAGDDLDGDAGSAWHGDARIRDWRELAHSHQLDHVEGVGVFDESQHR
jgi:hypothetical protein